MKSAFRSVLAYLTAAVVFLAATTFVAVLSLVPVRIICWAFGVPWGQGAVVGAGILAGGSAIGVFGALSLTADEHEWCGHERQKTGWFNRLHAGIQEAEFKRPSWLRRSTLPQPEVRK